LISSFDESFFKRLNYLRFFTREDVDYHIIRPTNHLCKIITLEFIESDEIIQSMISDNTKVDSNLPIQCKEHGVTDRELIVYKSARVITGKTTTNWDENWDEYTNSVNRYIVVSLTIPKGTRYKTSGSIADAKWRFEHAHVNDFIAYPNILVKDNIHVQSHHDSSFTYIRGTIAKPKNGFSESDSVCGAGIHAFANIESAWNYMCSYDFYIPLCQKKNILKLDPMSEYDIGTQRFLKEMKKREEEEEERIIEDEEYEWNSITNRKDLFKGKFEKSKSKK